jgi:hypothetical protein
VIFLAQGRSRRRSPGLPQSGDMATGLTAPFVAWQLARGRGRRLAVGFNVLVLLI